jgi:pimeloyl-ACP methyl ester carboxylesterase
VVSYGSSGKSRADSIVGGQHRTRVLTVGEGTPIVLLHGQGGSLENFRHNIPALAAAITSSPPTCCGTGARVRRQLTGG